MKKFDELAAVKAASPASYERWKPQARICRNAPGVPLVETAEGMRGWGHRHLVNESNTRGAAPQSRSGISVDVETLMKKLESGGGNSGLRQLPDRLGLTSIPTMDCSCCFHSLSRWKYAPSAGSPRPFTGGARASAMSMSLPSRASPRARLPKIQS